MALGEQPGRHGAIYIRSPESTITKKHNRTAEGFRIIRLKKPANHFKGYMITFLRIQLTILHIPRDLLDELICVQ